MFKVHVKLLKLQGQKMEEQSLYQNMQCAIVNNQNLLEAKNLLIKWFSNKDTLVIKFLFCFRSINKFIQDIK